MIAGLSRLPVHDRAEYLIELSAGKKALSVGLGGFDVDTPHSYNYLTADLRLTFSGRLAAASDATFLDLSAGAIEAYKPKIEASYFVADITDDPQNWPAELCDRRFDVVLLGEVLEHLSAPGTALSNLAGLLAPGGVFGISVPNAFDVAYWTKAIAGREVVHPEHVAYYSPSTLSRLLTDAGLIVTDIGWYRRPSGYRRTAREFLGPATLANLARKVRPQLSPGLVATARAAPDP